MPREAASTTETHAAIIRWLFGDVWTKGKFEQVPDYLAPQLAFHVCGRTVTQVPDDLVRIVNRWRAAFPDLRFEIGAILAEDDLAAVRLTR